jgi:hypothetical protein
MGRAPTGRKETEDFVVAQPFDRAKLEIADDDDSAFPPSEPASFSPRPSRTSTEVEQSFFNSLPTPLVSAMPSLPMPPPRKVSPERLAFSKRLFAMLFGALALLLGYALLQGMG